MRFSSSSRVATCDIADMDLLWFDQDFMVLDRRFGFERKPATRTSSSQTYFTAETQRLPQEDTGKSLPRIFRPGLLGAHASCVPVSPGALEACAPRDDLCVLCVSESLR